MSSLRAASCTAATDEERPTVIGEITPGNSTALRSGTRISASSGIGRRASAVERLPGRLSSAALGLARGDFLFLLFPVPEFHRISRFQVWECAG